MISKDLKGQTVIAGMIFPFSDVIVECSRVISSSLRKSALENCYNHNFCRNKTVYIFRVLFSFSWLACWYLRLAASQKCVLRDDEAVYWVSIGHYEAVAVGN